MKQLYHSETFEVIHTHVPDHQMHVFEVIDRKQNKEVVLCGEMALIFQDQLEAWHLIKPSQLEVETVLSYYAGAAQLSIALH